MIHVLFLSQRYIDPGSPINRCVVCSTCSFLLYRSNNILLFLLFCIRVQLSVILICVLPVSSCLPYMNFLPFANVDREVNRANPTSLGMHIFLLETARSSLSHRLWPAGSPPLLASVLTAALHCCQRCGCRKRCILLRNLFVSLPSPRRSTNKCCIFAVNCTPTAG